jgi:hypothetical protein
VSVRVRWANGNDNWSRGFRLRILVAKTALLERLILRRPTPVLPIGKAAMCHNEQESPGFPRTDWIKYAVDRGINQGIDELWAGNDRDDEPPRCNEPSTCTSRLMRAPTFNFVAALIRSHPLSRARRFRQIPMPMRRTGPSEQEECSGSRAC